MKRNRKRDVLFILIISLTISVLLGLSSVLNIVSFMNTYTGATATSNAIVASGSVNKIEYTLKYGKSLENYYGIEEMFRELRDLYGYLDSVYIVGPGADILYDTVFAPDGTEAEEDFVAPGELPDRLQSALETGETQIWMEGDTQHIMLPIRNRLDENIAGFGLAYHTSVLNASIREYVNEAALYTALAISVAICLLSLLFFIVRHGFQFKKLLLIVIFAVVVANTVFGVTAYSIFTSGYLALTRHTSDIYWLKIRSDVEGVVAKGVAYDELEGIDTYFNDMAARAEELESITLVSEMEAAEDSQFINTYNFAPDYKGNTAFLRVATSQEYVNGKITGILIEIAVSIVTALMIAAEVIIFILAVLTSEEKVNRAKTPAIMRDKSRSCQSYGIIRGLSFFFSMFRYMAMAFVSLVIIQIYEPISLFGWEIPYELVISLPLTAQMVSSMLGSFLSGKISSRLGWKPSACLGVLLMAGGSLLSALARSPLPFIGFQLLFGLGLGVSKTAVDLYGAVAASDDQMEEYTSNANASSIVGLSCASAIGAIIAGALGYSGAYMVMAGLGVLVALLLFVFGQNIITGKDEEEAQEGGGKKGFFDPKFVLYVLFLVLPYYFVIMFVDYLFPVYANSQGLTSSMIGYVFLAYGVATSYVGTFLCRVLTRRLRTVFLMCMLLLILGAGLGVFALYNNLILAVAFVLLIALCDGIMPSLQFKHVYALPITRHLGFSRALGIEGFFTGVISSIAPMVFSMVMIVGNTGFMVAAAAVVLCALLFRFGNLKAAKEE